LKDEMKKHESKKEKKTKKPRWISHT